METWIWIAIGAGAAAVVALAAGIAIARGRADRRSRWLRNRFGREYDRLVADHGRRKPAEEELVARLERREQLEVRPLSPTQRSRYLQEWEGVQARFHDMPATALGQANGLVIDIMRERGYPIEDFDTRSADISVDYPQVVDDYRAAREIVVRADRGEAVDEDYGVALDHFRRLIGELLSSGETVGAERPLSAAP